MENKFGATTGGVFHRNRFKVVGRDDVHEVADDKRQRSRIGDKSAGQDERQNHARVESKRAHHGEHDRRQNKRGAVVREESSDDRTKKDDVDEHELSVASRSRAMCSAAHSKNLFSSRMSEIRMIATKAERRVPYDAGNDAHVGKVDYAEKEG